MGNCDCEGDAMSLTVLDCFLFFIVGSSLASHIALIVSRVPSGEQFMSGRSHCDQCGRTLAFWEVIPFFGWILCKGQCRCGYKIPAHHLAIEALSGVAVVLGYLIAVKF